MVWCNRCDVLLSMKRDFVREMKKDMEFQNIEDEREIDPPFSV